jgi:hypothetical protein
MQFAFNEEIDNEVRKLLEEGHTIRHIRETLGLTKWALASRMRRMRVRGAAPSNPQGANQHNNANSPVRVYGYCKTVEHDPRRASIMHLVDLKRAGHSPTQTELTISSERPLAARSYIHHGSLIGSPAALCEAS